MFASCLKIVSFNGIIWPVHDPWSDQLPHQEYGQCRTSVVIQKTYLQQYVELIWNLPSILTSPSQSVKTVLETSFETNLFEKPMHAVVTILSYKLQVSSATLWFKPTFYFASRHPILTSLFFWGLIFIFWFFVMIIIQIFQ